MEEKKIDRRVRKTKKQIRLALTSLMLEKGVGEITVREIAERADVNRGTFYAHYKDVDDLLNSLEEEVFARLDEVGRTHKPKKSMEATGYLAALMTLCGENTDVFRALVCRNGNLNFQHRLNKTLREQYLRGYLSLNCGMDPGTQEYFCSFVVTGMLSLAKDWINGGMRETPEEIAALGGSFVLHGVQALK